MSFRTDTRALVMAALAEGPQHGYGIAKIVHSRSGSALKLGEGQIYPILRELESDGFVVGEWENTDTDQPRRRYSLTESCQAEFRKRREAWEKYVNSVQAALGPELRPEGA